MNEKFAVVIAAILTIVLARKFALAQNPRVLRLVTRKLDKTFPGKPENKVKKFVRN